MSNYATKDDVEKIVKELYRMVADLQAMHKKAGKQETAAEKRIAHIEAYVAAVAAHTDIPFTQTVPKVS